MRLYRRFHPAAVLASIGVLAAACGSASTPPGATSGVPSASASSAQATSAPTSASDSNCAALGAFMRPLAEREAKRPWPRYNAVAYSTTLIGASTGLESDRDAGDGQVGEGAAGIKVDGERVVTFGGRPNHADFDSLQVLDTANGRLTVLGTLQMPDQEPHDVLLLPEHRALVLGSRDAYGPDATHEAVLTLVDLAEPARPAVLRTERIPGQFVSARLLDGVVRLVLTSPAGTVLTAPGTGESEEDTRDRNLAAVRAARDEDWLPTREITDADGTVSRAPLLGCADVRIPAEPAGFGIVSVLTLDPESDDEIAAAGTATGVAAVGTLAHTATRRLYIGTHEREDAAGNKVTSRTALHAFDITDRARTSYVASGRVRGQVSGAPGVSERGGFLRVVTGRHGGALSKSLGAAVFKEDGAVLRMVGEIPDLRPGNGVRVTHWVDDIAIVGDAEKPARTFVLDMSDPTRPRVVGTPRLPGHVGLLYPVGGRRILGVGPVPDSPKLRLGVVLYDFADPAHPKPTSSVDGDPGAPYVSFSGGAFAWLADRGLAIVPANGPDDAYFAAVVHLDAAGRLRTVGRFDAGGYVRGIVPAGDNVVVDTDGSIVLVDASTFRVLDSLSEGQGGKG